MACFPLHYICSTELNVLADLTTDEVADIFCCVHKVAPLIEKHYEATAMNIAVQVSTFEYIYKISTFLYL